MYFCTYFFLLFSFSSNRHKYKFKVTHFAVRLSSKIFNDVHNLSKILSIQRGFNAQYFTKFNTSYEMAHHIIIVIYNWNHFFSLSYFATIFAIWVQHWPVALTSIKSIFMFLQFAINIRGEKKLKKYLRQSTNSWISLHHEKRYGNVIQQLSSKNLIEIFKIRNLEWMR